MQYLTASWGPEKEEEPKDSVRVREGTESQRAKANRLTVGVVGVAVVQLAFLVLAGVLLVSALPAVLALTLVACVDEIASGRDRRRARRDTH